MRGPLLVTAPPLYLYYWCPCYHHAIPVLKTQVISLSFVVLRLSEIQFTSLSYTGVILSLCSPLVRIICITILAVVITLGFPDFSAGFDRKLSVHAFIAGEFVCFPDDPQSTL